MKFKPFTFILFISCFLSTNSFAQVADLPWSVDPLCNSIATTGIAAITCGTTVDVSPANRYTFGLVDMNGALPATGRIDVTDMQDVYHHPAWLLDSIGNVFGLALDDCGNIYVAASANYASQFYLATSIIRYGEIGGGAEDLSAAGTVYIIDGQTGQPSVFAVLPQQAFAFQHIGCEGGNPITRNTGPSLGNIVFHFTTKQFYVSNFEDGRIYRLDNAGNILDSYDPGTNDNGAPGPPILNEIAYGLAITEDETQLFYGTTGSMASANYAQILSIDLNADGSFAGTIDNTTLPVGASWDNYSGTETFHIELDLISGNPFGLVPDTYFCSDLAFTPSGDLLTGMRSGCGQSLFTSYNHGGQITLIESSTGGIYNTVEGIIYTGGPSLGAGNESYGGLDVFENPAGTVEFVISSGDMITDFEGPHGICTQEEGSFGSSYNPASPSGIISYGTADDNSDPKGIGGDVEMFRGCNCVVVCPMDISGFTNPVILCNNDVFDLDYTLIGGNAEVDIVWTNEAGETINPTELSLQNTNCAPAIFSFFLTAICLEDTTVILTDTVEVQIITDDITPFVTTIQEPCFVDVVIAAECTEFLSLVGTLPEISPGDSATVNLSVVTNDGLPCATTLVELSYNCPTCSIQNPSLDIQECQDSFFMVELDLEVLSGSNSFNVNDGNGNDLGNFNYDDLPVIIGPFLGDSTLLYTLNIQDTNDENCIASIDIPMTDCLNLCGTYKMPNAFTPNNDSTNDEFFVVTFGPVRVLEFKIYNRWGQMVHNQPTPWDGTYNNKPHPADLLMYEIVLETDCEKERLIGDVTLIR